MSRILICCRRLGWVLLVSLLLLGAAGFYLYGLLPKLGGDPERAVLGMPAVARTPQPAYEGPHPRIAGRPQETFSFPIGIGEFGPLEPLYAGPLQYPFLCGTDHTRTHAGRRAEPAVDNHRGEGVAVYAHSDSGERGALLGYSRDCRFPTVARYYYKPVGAERFMRFEDVDPALVRFEWDMDTLDLAGACRPFVVRLETGTINRFFYALAVPASEYDSLASPSSALWNGKLIYQFRGGVGIGHRQGNLKSKDVLKRRREQLAEGYAVIYSSGNQTSNHYNIWLAEETAVRVKHQFVGLYGEPDYTVGIGGSGGAIQQYLIAQNRPGVIDGALALYAYPDMASQIIYVMDCELLEHYFERVAPNPERWASWRSRQLFEGLSASEQGFNYYQWMTALADGINGRSLRVLDGGGECVRSWRGLTSLVHNPTFIHFPLSFSESVYRQTHWSHWDDLREFYGVGSDGYANSSWDNEGVQYGLESLIAGRITVDEFLDLNAKVGGWKKPAQMRAERWWLLQRNFWPADFSVWGEHNFKQAGNKFDKNGVAPRTRASVEAIRGAFESGTVFSGYIDIPVVDLRHYLDPEQDMHHSLASFATRQRIERAMGGAGQQLIWITRKPHTPIAEALDVLGRWIEARKDHPEKGLLATRPADAADRCYGADGQLLAAGLGVWDGPWNGRAVGACMQRYPSFATSRQLAGGAVAGDVFKCQLQSVSAAIAAGVYAGLDMSAYLPELQRIFPTGVCDYRKPGVGEPGADWREQLLAAMHGKEVGTSVLAQEQNKRGGAPVHLPEGEGLAGAVNLVELSAENSPVKSGADNPKGI